jgi:hypothetical protein
MSVGTHSVPGVTQIAIPETHRQRAGRLLVSDASSVRRSPRDEIHVVHIASPLNSRRDPSP